MSRNLGGCADGRSREGRGYWPATSLFRIFFRCLKYLNIVCFITSWLENSSAEWWVHQAVQVWISASELIFSTHCSFRSFRCTHRHLWSVAQSGFGYLWSIDWCQIGEREKAVLRSKCWLVKNGASISEVCGEKVSAALLLGGYS